MNEIDTAIHRLLQSQLKRERVMKEKLMMSAREKALLTALIRTLDAMNLSDEYGYTLGIHKAPDGVGDVWRSAKEGATLLIELAQEEAA